MQTPALGVVMAPVSPAVAKLLHKLTAALINEHPALPPSAIVPVPLGKPLEQDASYNEAGRHLYCTFEHGRVVFNNWNRSDVGGNLSPFHWYGREYRRDEAGRGWDSYLGAHVLDDFGYLVPVDGAA